MNLIPFSFKLLSLFILYAANQVIANQEIASISNLLKLDEGGEQQVALQQNCEIWFKNKGFKQNKTCLLECISSTSDLDIFYCSEFCPYLCNRYKVQDLTGRRPKITIPNHHRRLKFSKAEQLLFWKYPLEMLQGFLLSWNAEMLCFNLFPVAKSYSNTNGRNVTNACQHFVRAALLYKKFGPQFAMAILNAHEYDPKVSLEATFMDLENNRLGLMAAEQLLKQGNLNLTAILESLQELLEKEILIHL